MAQSHTDMIDIMARTFYGVGSKDTGDKRRCRVGARISLNQEPLAISSQALICLGHGIEQPDVRVDLENLQKAWLAP